MCCMAADRRPHSPEQLSFFASPAVASPVAGYTEQRGTSSVPTVYVVL